MLNWRRISTVEVPGLTEKFKSMRISPLTSKYYKKRVRHFRLTSQSSFSFCWLGVMRMRFSLRALYHLNHLNSSIHLGALTDNELGASPSDMNLVLSFACELLVLSKAQIRLHMLCCTHLYGDFLFLLLREYWS